MTTQTEFLRDSNEDTIEPLVRGFLDSRLVSGICWDFPEISGQNDVRRVLEQGFRAGVAAERECGARLLGEARMKETDNEAKRTNGDNLDFFVRLSDRWAKKREQEAATMCAKRTPTEEEIDRAMVIGKWFTGWTDATGPCPISVTTGH